MESEEPEINSKQASKRDRTLNTYLLQLCIIRFIYRLLFFVGIDDMFVILQSLQNLESPNSSDITKVISKTLGKSGVAITVTSLTDVLAFGVGASTVSRSIFFYNCLDMLHYG